MTESSRKTTWTAAERIAKERAEQEAREREREERRLARLQARGKKKSRDDREDR